MLGPPRSVFGSKETAARWPGPAPALAPDPHSHQDGTHGEREPGALIRRGCFLGAQITNAHCHGIWYLASRHW